MESNNTRTAHLKLKRRVANVIEEKYFLLKEILGHAIITNGKTKPRAMLGPSISCNRLCEYVSVVKLEVEIPGRAVATNGTNKPNATRGPGTSSHRLGEYVSVVKLEEWRPYGKEK